jgi:UDP-GlcNAc:undecaprenyl-phosphate/decaprenyl-phosphate GlcNAc-1-phosphate transferase
MILKLVTLSFLFDFALLSVQLWMLTVLGFFIAFCVTYFAIPIIVKGAKYKGLYAESNDRGSHEEPIPVLGGVGIFAGFILSTNIVAGAYFNFELSYLITGLIVIFIVGVKDDLMGGKPWKKLFGQTLAVIIICVLANVRISDLHGLLGIGHIPYLLSVVLTIIVMIVIINGFNLIDGIDGLASGIGILVSFVLGVWFYLTGNIACTVMCSALTGGLIAFFNFNVLNQKNKIFLGDTGSLTIGLVLGVLVVRFLELEPTADGVAAINSVLAFAISLFILPLFDTLRVFSLRIAQGKSPFKGDHQHIHHRMLELGFSHFRSTIILLSVNLTFIIICYILQDLGNIILIAIQFVLATLLSIFLLFLVKKRNGEKLNLSIPK